MIGSFVFPYSCMMAAFFFIQKQEKRLLFTILYSILSDVEKLLQKKKYTMLSLLTFPLCKY